LLVLAAVGRLSRRQIVYPLGIFGMFILQSIFVGLRTDAPMISALHPVNGFAILLVSIMLAREAWLARTRPEASPAAVAGTATSTLVR
jgi:hypothetical protein